MRTREIKVEQTVRMGIKDLEEKLFMLVNTKNKGNMMFREAALRISLIFINLEHCQDKQMHILK